MKKLKIAFAIFMCVTLFSGCTDQKQKKYIKTFTGEWNCKESPLESKDIYSGYIVMDIQKNGEFTMYDAEAGNPVIKGKMESVTKDHITLNCSKDEDFDPPAGWKNMQKKERIRYNQKGTNKLYFIYGEGKNKVTLVFYK